MELATVLERNREVILRKWFDLIVEDYPRNASAFLAKQKDRFRNPVGHAISEALGPLYDHVVSGTDTDVLRDALDSIIRIRSVQDLTASEAVGFVFRLKTLIRETLDGQVLPAEESAGLAEIDSRIDCVALLAFDKYTECREQLHDIRGNEMKARWARMLERMNGMPPVADRPEESPMTTFEPGQEKRGGEG
jgi:hypothetical protein